jgi:hypothetical protein
VNPDKLNQLTQFLFALGTVVGPICAYLVARMGKKKPVEEPEEDSKPIVRVGPVVILALAASAWLYLFTKNPELAQVTPLRLLEPAAMAKVGPGPLEKACAGVNDCPSGCACQGMQCKCSADRPRSQPRPRKPIASLDGTVCADCVSLPWMLTALASPLR